MKRLNINVTEDFEIELRQYMQGAGIVQKSEAIRRAIHEAAERVKFFSAI